ncbi:MAG: hypothetical protein ACXVCV_00460 [Polyangia bacterium]
MAFAVVVMSWGALAFAELPVKHLDSVRVSVANKSQKAFGLHASAGGGWRLDLEGDGDSADIIDVTPGTPARTITLSVITGTIKFDSVRFAGGHVYRVQLNGKKGSSASLVYLYPDASKLKLRIPPQSCSRSRR